MMHAVHDPTIPQNPRLVGGARISGFPLRSHHRPARLALNPAALLIGQLIPDFAHPRVVLGEDLEQLGVEM
jgi:hypothetical protein